METINLDFRECKYIASIQRVIKDAFGFPEHYGANLDALWDCLEYYTDDDLQVNIIGLRSLPKDLEEYALRMQVVFSQAHKRTPNMIFSVIS